MPLPLESVPNFSEGRDAAVIKQIGRALAEKAELLDVHTDDLPRLSWSPVSYTHLTLPTKA